MKNISLIGTDFGGFWVIFGLKNVQFFPGFPDFPVPYFPREISRYLISRFPISRREMCISIRVKFKKKDTFQKMPIS